MYLTCSLILLLFLSSCSTAIDSTDINLAEVRRFNLQGLQAIREKNFLEAQANFDLAYKISPNPESLDGLGVCEYYLGNYLRAQKLYIKAYKLDSNYLNSLINLAYLYELGGLRDLAESLYDYLMKKNPQNHRLLNNFSAFQFDYYGKRKRIDVEFSLLQAKSIYPDELILENLIKIKEHGDKS